MTAVQQYNDYACVAAYLESIKKDFGSTDFDHQVFVLQNLDLFNGGQEIEGSCDLRLLGQVLQRCGLKGKVIVNGALACAPHDEAIVLFVYWDGLSGQKHFVRAGQQEQDNVQVMNPQGATMENIPVAWIQRAFLIEKL